jgi:hypothetical protein
MKYARIALLTSVFLAAASGAGTAFAACSPGHVIALGVPVNAHTVSTPGTDEPLLVALRLVLPQNGNWRVDNSARIPSERVSWVRGKRWPDTVQDILRQAGVCGELDYNTHTLTLIDPNAAFSYLAAARDETPAAPVPAPRIEPTQTTAFVVSPEVTVAVPPRAPAPVEAPILSEAAPPPVVVAPAPVEPPPAVAVAEAPPPPPPTPVVNRPAPAPVPAFEPVDEDIFDIGLDEAPATVTVAHAASAEDADYANSRRPSAYGPQPSFVSYDTNADFDPVALDGDLLAVINRDLGEYELRVGESLRANLSRWATSAGYQLVWRAAVDYPVDAGLNFPAGTSFNEAVSTTLKAYWKRDRPLAGKLYKNNVLLITGHTR